MLFFPTDLKYEPTYMSILYPETDRTAPYYIRMIKGDRSFSVPSQSCVVLQFDGGRVCKRLYTRSEVKGVIYQKLPRFNDHVVLRKDRLYLFPVPIHIFVFNNYNQTKTNIHHDHISLQYMYPKSFKLQQFSQYNSPRQKKFSINSSMCCISLTSPPIYVPISIFTEALLMPATEKLKTQSSFIFSSPFLPVTYAVDVKSWHKESPSWVSSTIYFINCSSLNQSRSIKFIPECEVINNLQLKMDSLCLKTKPVYSNQESNPYVLILTLKNISNVNIPIGILSVSSVWKKLCGNYNYFYYWAKDVFLYGGITKTKLTCSQLQINYKINSNQFDRNNIIKIQVQISDFQYAEFTLNPDILQMFNKTSNKIKIKYQWEKQKVKSIQSFFQNQYRLFVIQETVSWFYALDVCRSSNMSLPTFHNKRHVSEIIVHVQNTYGFQLIALFVGIQYSVSIERFCFWQT